jgi:hypothetical protein
MSKLHVQSGLLGAALLAAAVATSGSARAGDDKDKHDEGGASAGFSLSLGGGSAHADAKGDVKGGSGTEDKPSKAEKEEAKEEENPFYLGMDFVYGTTTTPTVSQSAPSSNALQGSPERTTSRVAAYSFLFDAGYEFSEAFELRLRVPLSSATIYDPAYQRGSGGVGNVEIEPEYEARLADGLKLKLGLGVALPTAQGVPVPDSADAVPAPAGGINQSGYDRFAAQQASAAARGYEENALFEPSHLGIVPKITLAWKSDQLRIDPWVKLENLVSTESGGKFVDELVFGVNAGYRVTRAFEPALRVWVNAPLSNADFTTVAVVEPQLKFHLHEVEAMAGAILPIAGPLTSPYGAGVRMGLGLHY